MEAVPEHYSERLNLTSGGYEQVEFCRDEDTGLRSIIVIHDTTLGPALGGVRMMSYETEAAALTDCLRLAEGMTYKAAAANVALGGGKSVIIGDPHRDKNEALLRAHGRFIQALDGRYIPGIDIGTEMADMEILAKEVARVSCAKGNPSPMTALGVLCSIRACVDEVFGTRQLSGIRVAIQGVGHVGSSLARFLAREGATLLLADIDESRSRALAANLGAESVPGDEIISAPCDVFSPCAVGAMMNDETISLLNCRIIAGSANNVLAERRHGKELHEAGILYGPDYFVNAGGLIFLEEEILGHDSARAERRVRSVGDIVERLIARSKGEGVSTAEMADIVVQERLQGARQKPPLV